MKRKISVLCAVRNDACIRSVMRELDDGEHYSFCIEHSGTDALRSAGRIVPDILVTEDILPGLDGLALVDSLRRKSRGRTPCIIGGVSMPFSLAAFERRAVDYVLDLPFCEKELKRAILNSAEDADERIDWEKAQEGYLTASLQMESLGMRSVLRGFGYLCYAAALAAMNESRLCSIGERIYAPIAQKHNTTPQNVERLIRHAVESTIDAAKAEELYAFFGNTIDPARGKPTNAQMIGMLAQKVRVGRK